jgi:uncharacterized protein YjbI with pentapeptide repeats
MQAIDIIRLVVESSRVTGMQVYYLGNALKYRLRAGYKGDASEDIAKAMKYERWLAESGEGAPEVCVSCQHEYNNEGWCADCVFNKSGSENLFEPLMCREEDEEEEDIYDPEHLRILNQGRKAWNKWRKDNPGIVPNLASAPLSGKDLSEYNFAFANLAWSDLSYAVLTKADLYETRMTGADLANANLEEARVVRTNLYKANLLKSNMEKANLKNANLDEANLYGARMAGAIMTGATLPEGVELPDMRREEDEEEEDKYDPEHLRILNKGRDVWNQWRQENPEIIPNLSEAPLANKNLWGYNFANANLSYSDLTNANLAWSVLTDANLASARVINANLASSDLTGANLIDARMTDANLANARMTGADMKGTKTTRMKTAHVDLTSTDGLTTEQIFQAKIGDGVILPEGVELPGSTVVRITTEEARHGIKHQD